MLEEACFAFAQKHLPSVLDKSGFDCPAAVELSKWTKIFSKHRHKLVKDTPSFTLKDPSFSGLLVSARKLRNIAVHRAPTTAVEVARLVGAAAALTEILQDHRRAASLLVMHSEIKEQIEVVEFSRQILRQQADAELENIHRAREELDRREREVAAGLLDEDARHRRTVGRLLEEAAWEAREAWTERCGRSPARSGTPDSYRTASPGSHENAEQSQDTERGIGVCTIA